MTQIERMTIALPIEMAATIKLAVASGDYASSSEVFRDAIRAWKQKRHLQQQEAGHIMEGIRQGLVELETGKTRPAEEVLNRLEKKYKDMQ